MSVTGLSAKIAAADSTGVAGWNGPHGIKAQQEDIAALLLARGVMVVADVATLALISVAEARIALVKEVALYVYNPVAASNPPANDILVAGGGRWEWICAVGPTSYSEVFGDSTAETFTITHNLNTLTPHVQVLETLNGLPYSVNNDYTLSVISANAVSLTYPDPPGTQQFTAKVRK